MRNLRSHLPPVRPRNPPFSTEAKDRRRLLCVALLLLALFSSLFVQFFRIQVLEHEKWAKLAKAQHTVIVKEPFKRGVFYGNNVLYHGQGTSAQPLVIDLVKSHLFIDPSQIPEKKKEAIAKGLTQFLDLKGEDISKMRSHFDKKSRSRKLAMWLDTETREQITSWWQALAKKEKIPQNALYFVKDYQRSYPFGKLLGQVLHSVRATRDEVTGQCIPTGGLEYVFDHHLQGKPGKKVFYRSPRKALDVGQVIEMPEDGADIFLTIDPCLQSIAEEEMEKQVKKAQAKRGWAVLMDPVTGQIYALAQYPFFYPGCSAQYFNDPELLQETQVKAVTDPYEPGSTMKAITLAVGLIANEERRLQGKPPLFDPDEKMNVTSTPFPGRIKPIKDLRSHKYMNMNMAMQKSSNVYMAHVIQRVIEEMGEAWYRNVLQNVFGLGEKTGIELPAESPGAIPTPGKLHPNGTLEWSKPTPYSLAMGHNILVNTLQMLRCFAIIANGGYDVTPTLVHQVIKNGEKIEPIFGRLKDGSEKKRLLPEGVSDLLISAMRYVTKPGGAAEKGDIYGYSEAGKTSTSEKITDGVYSKKDHISTFIGFAPVKNPKFVLIVVIDEPAYLFIPGVGSNQYGGNCAAPAFRRIGSRALEYMGVTPDDPHGYPVGDPRRDPEKGDWLSNTKALNKLYETWNR